MTLITGLPFAMSHHRNGPVAPGFAFITGGARGLGNAIAVSFAKEGAKGVALVDIQDEQTFQQGKEAVEKYGAKCITIRADVTDEAQVERAVQTAVKEFGRIDYAANFAGISGPLTAVVDTDLQGWKKVLEVNTVGVWLSMKHELKQMIKQDSIDVEEGRVAQRGSIVNCASVNSIMSGAGTSGYTASKHAVLGMTKAGALEARKQDVRINCVSPVGFIPVNVFDPTLISSGISSHAASQRRIHEGHGQDDVGKQGHGRWMGRFRKAPREDGELF